MIPRTLAMVFCGAALCAQNSPPPQADSERWKALEFLMGAWEAKTAGGSAGAAASGTYTFRLLLRDHVLVRETVNAGCKGPADFDCRHGDLLYVFQDFAGAPFKAIYFDNEGHVIHYDVTTPAPNTAVFLSPESTAGPQFRLSYELRGQVLNGKFQMRMPGQGEFKSYLEWSGGRK